MNDDNEIVKIKIPSRYREFAFGEWHDKEAVAEFTLGKGPCGKTVIGLKAFWTDGGTCIRIAQLCDDGVEKQFFYPLSQLTGRIEIEMAP